MKARTSKKQRSISRPCSVEAKNVENLAKKVPETKLDPSSGAYREEVILKRTDRNCRFVFFLSFTKGVVKLYAYRRSEERKCLFVRKCRSKERKCIPWFVVDTKRRMFVLLKVSFT